MPGAAQEKGPAAAAATGDGDANAAATSKSEVATAEDTATAAALGAAPEMGRAAVAAMGGEDSIGAATAKYSGNGMAAATAAAERPVTFAARYPPKDRVAIQPRTTPESPRRGVKRGRQQINAHFPQGVFHASPGRSTTLPEHPSRVGGAPPPSGHARVRPVRFRARAVVQEEGPRAKRTDGVAHPSLHGGGVGPAGQLDALGAHHTPWRGLRASRASDSPQESLAAQGLKWVANAKTSQDRCYNALRAAGSYGDAYDYKAMEAAFETWSKAMETTCKA